METLQASVSVALHAIERLIFTTRGQRVMLDSDLARVYGVATRRLNEQGRRKLPLVFTEHGAIMAANVLNTPAVVQASVQVVRAFVRLREMALSNLELARRLDELENRYDGQFGVVFDALRQLMSPPPAPRIGFRLTKDGAKQEAKKGTRVPGSHGNGRTVSGETAAHDAGGTDSQAQREHPLQVGGSWSHDGVGCPDHHGRPAGRSREPKGPHPMPTPIALLFLFSVALPGAFAWNGHEVTEGPLRLFIPEIPEVTAPAEPTTVQVEVENTGQAQVTGQLEVRDFVDGWHVVGAGKKPFALAAGATQQLEFALAANPPVYSALYPVHAHAVFRDGGKERTVRAVRIFSVRVPTKQEAASAGGEFVVNTVPKDSALPLWMLGTQRVAWNYYDGPPVFEAPGWSGSSPQSSANMGVGSLTRGDTRASINMHPPWKPGGGAIFCDYLLKLPDQRPIKLVFAVAIRDSAEKEPPSDGVLFRVWTGEDRQGKDAKVLYEQFTAAKRWLDGSANLSAYAGKTVLVRLESHPGPNRNTTCDSSYWAEPTVVAGEGLTIGKLEVPGAEAVRASQALARDVVTGRKKPDGKTTFLLGASPAAAKGAAVIEPGLHGLLDGLVTLAVPEGVASFRGFVVDIEDLPAGRWPSAFAFQGVRQEAADGGVRFVHQLEYRGERVSLTIALRAAGPALRVSASCPKRLSNFSVGPWDRHAPRVYYGHGYCVVDPKAFRAGFGGHNLATSHVGCDFEGGLSVLQAVDNPPNFFDINPDSRTYALNTDQDCTLTLVPGKSAFACAVAYRPLFDKHPAGGVKRLAGRMCFDIWGGKYRDIADRMQTMIRYGLTDSFLTVHNWQRWGYDYRLPDIWPPNPQFGTVEDMKRIGEVCGKHDIPWGLHDNYIDFYPDATDYSYQHVYFTRDGRPTLAWLNEGREAQSYKFRPDRILPFVQRNLKLVKEGVRPTHYFIDVFTSSGCMDWWDADGNYHSGNETRKYWGEAFAWIRDYLGNNAPTTSEAGHDQLIGYLDGADCQWLGLSDTPRKHVIKLDCKEWERVPWYDAVNHANFILHGVGYSGRYEGGRPRQTHGINSDDYLSAEILSGHALMTDAGSWGRDAVRKYYLAQDAAKGVALRDLTSVEFVGGDVHRQKVTWDNGTTAYVNRGATEWQVAGRALPQYGFHVEHGDLTATVEKRDGKWAESSRGPSGWYCNARTVVAGAQRQLRITPRLENFQHLGDGKLTYDLVWDAKEPAPADLTVFVHFCSDKASRRDKIAFQDDHTPKPPTSQWQGEVRIKRTVTVPTDATGEYAIMVGLHSGGGRVLLGGFPGGESRILVGTLDVKRTAAGIASLTLLAPPPAEPAPEPPINAPGTFVDFGFARTDGAFRVQEVEGGLRVIPLPDSPRFEMTLRLEQLVGRTPTVKSVVVLGFDVSAVPKPVKFGLKGDALDFAHDGKAFAYEVRW